MWLIRDLLTLLFSISSPRGIRLLLFKHLMIRINGYKNERVGNIIHLHVSFTIERENHLGRSFSCAILVQYSFHRLNSYRLLSHFRLLQWMKNIPRTWLTNIFPENDFPLNGYFHLTLQNVLKTKMIKIIYVSDDWVCLAYLNNSLALGW